MNSIKIKIVNNSNYPLPQYATSQSAGIDIRANIIQSMTIKPFERVAVPTGLSIALPEGYEAQLRPRSGLALNYGITLLNTPGTIDADYRGEIKVILSNLSKDDYIINPGDRICQMVVTQYTHIEWEEVEKLVATQRGVGGFGSTGRK